MDPIRPRIKDGFCIFKGLYNKTNNKPKKTMQQTLYFRPAESKIVTIWPFTEKVCRPCFSPIPHFADEENWSQKVRGWGCVFISFPTTNGEAGNDRNVSSHSLEARSSKSRCQEGGPLLEALRGKPFLVSLRFWCLQATLGVPWSTDASLKTRSLSSHDILPPPHTRTPVIGFRVLPNPV